MPDPTAKPTAPPPTGSTNSSSKTTIAVGISYNTSEARKFGFDATAMAEVTAELVGVPAPTELTRLLAERIKQSSAPAPAPPAASGDSTSGDQAEAPPEGESSDGEENSPSDD